MSQEGSDTRGLSHREAGRRGQREGERESPGSVEGGCPSRPPLPGLLSAITTLSPPGGGGGRWLHPSFGGDYSSKSVLPSPVEKKKYLRRRGADEHPLAYCLLKGRRGCQVAF